MPSVSLILVSCSPIGLQGTDMFQHICNLVAPGGTLLFVHHVPRAACRVGRAPTATIATAVRTAIGRHAAQGPDFNKFMSVRDARAALMMPDVVKDDVVARHLSCGLVRIIAWMASCARFALELTA